MVASAYIPHERALTDPPRPRYFVWLQIVRGQASASGVRVRVRVRVRVCACVRAAAAATGAAHSPRVRSPQARIAPTRGRAQVNVNNWRHDNTMALCALASPSLLASFQQAFRRANATSRNNNNAKS